jgi:hypothetical protein
MTTRAAFAGLLALCTALATPASAQDVPPTAIPVRDARLIDTAIAALPAQRPGVVDLYALGVAGDATEDVFRNEARYFVDLARQRLRARGAMALVNHLDSVEGDPAPLATYDNLAHALQGLAARMDPAEDMLLVYLTMHGTPEHELAVVFPPFVEDLLVPEDLVALLDESGIRHRVVVVSACYSGGFIPRLRDADTLVMTASRADRPSFGCGNASNVTFFGRAWMVEGLNRHAGLFAAFDDARARVGAWELGEALEASQPQISAGRRIRKRLALWQSQTPPGEPLAYPHPLDPVGGAREDLAEPAGLPVDR